MTRRLKTAAAPAGFVARRSAPDREPAIGPAGPRHRSLGRAWLGPGKERLPLPRQSAEIVRVDRGLPTPPEAFPYGETRIASPLPVQEFLRAAGLCAPRKRRDCVDDFVIEIHDTAASG